MATSVYSRLGLRPIINAQGNRTVIGGSTPTGEVREAMDEAEMAYIPMDELLDATGRHIADVLGVEAAYVTSGGSAALALSTAACMTGMDGDRIQQIPDTTGMKDEVVLARAQRYGYDRSYTVPGAKLVFPGDEEGCTADEMNAAINDNTTAVAYLINANNDDGTVPTLDETVEIAHAKGVPVIGDAAAQNYPIDYLLRNAQTPDLACFGAKYLGAPHSAGWLCGKKDLVDAAAANGFIAFQYGPRGFARPMKLDRQEIVGVVTAIDSWMEMDHEGRLIDNESRLTTIHRGVGDLPGVTSRVESVQQYYGFTLFVDLDTDGLGKTKDDVVRLLDEGEPRIWVLADGEEDTIQVNAHCLNEGEDKIVAQRLREVLTA